MHGDFSPFDGAETECDIEQFVRECLDEVVRSTLYDGDKLFGELAVMHGLGQVIGRRRDRGVEPEGAVDNEILTIAFFEVEDTVKSTDCQSGQSDLIAAYVDRTRHPLQALPGSGDPYRVKRRANLVDANRPRSGRRRERADGRRRILTLTDGPGRTARIGQ